MHTFLPENVDDMITAVLTCEEIEFERVGARRGGAYRILENGQLVGHVSVIANPNGDGWQLNESLPASARLSTQTADTDTFTRATKAIWAGLNSAAEFAAKVAARTAGKDTQRGEAENGQPYSKQARADYFKRIKDANTCSSYVQVATKANGDKDFTQEHGYAYEHTVRNDYIKMGWPWERADRIR